MNYHDRTDPVLAHLKAHYRPDIAADLLAATQPLMAIAWDEGYQAKDSEYPFGPRYSNPYKKDKATQ